MVKQVHLNTLLDTVIMTIMYDDSSNDYVEHSDSNKTMSFNVIDKGLLKT